MALIFLLTLIIAPLVEISIFISVGQEIGALAVIGLTVATAFFGLAIVRAQGIDTVIRARRELEAQRAPIPELLHGALLALAGLFLLIPGFLTDGLGALLLIPPLRHWLIIALLRHVRPGAADVIIDGEFQEQQSEYDGSKEGRVIEGEIVSKTGSDEYTPR